MTIETLTTAHPVVQGALGAAIYGLVFYVENRLGDDPESFSPVKFGSTVCFGALFGAALGGLGINPTYDSIGYILTSYAGTLALVEYSFKALINGEQRHAQRGFGAAVDQFIATTFSHGTSREQVSESINRGGEEYGALDEDEQREAWEDEYPDEDTAWQADDEALGEGEYEGVVRDPEPEGEREEGADDEASTPGELPPA